MNPSADAAYSNFDVRNSFNLSAITNLPLRLQVQSHPDRSLGLPYTPVIGFDTQNDANDWNDRAIVNGSCTAQLYRQPSFFDRDPLRERHHPTPAKAATSTSSWISSISPVPAIGISARRPSAVFGTPRPHLYRRPGAVRSRHQPFRQRPPGAIHRPHHRLLGGCLPSSQVVAPALAGQTPQFASLISTSFLMAARSSVPLTSIRTAVPSAYFLARAMAFNT